MILAQGSTNRNAYHGGLGRTWSFSSRARTYNDQLPSNSFWNGPSVPMAYRVLGHSTSTAVQTKLLSSQKLLVIYVFTHVCSFLPSSVIGGPRDRKKTTSYNSLLESYCKTVWETQLIFHINTRLCMACPFESCNYTLKKNHTIFITSIVNAEEQNWAYRFMACHQSRMSWSD